MSKRLVQGFTLIEVLIALVLVTVLSLIALQAFGPWMAFKGQLDTERKLQTVRSALMAAYEANAFTADNTANHGQFVFATQDGTSALVTNLMPGTTQCASQADNWNDLGPFLTESAANFERDGHGNTLCVVVSNRLAEFRDGAAVNYRLIAVISPGRNGELDTDITRFATEGVLKFDADDTGIVVNGFDIQLAKLRTLQDRMERLATVYENYFTTRFLGNEARDITIDYFYQGPGGDATGLVAPTQGFEPVDVVLAPLGVGGVDASTPYENNGFNFIEINNTNGSVNGLSVRSPEAEDVSHKTVPYTAILRAPLPGGQYLVKVVMGNY